MSDDVSRRLGAMRRAAEESVPADQYEKYLQPQTKQSEQPRIDKMTCETCRELIETDDMSITELAQELGYSRQSISKHVNGRCQHKHGHMDVRRCNVARIMRDEGELLSEIADKFSVHISTVAYHVQGRCDCDSNVSVVPKQRVTQRLCSRMSHMSSWMSYREIADETQFSKATVCRHVTGDCQHD